MFINIRLNKSFKIFFIFFTLIMAIIFFISAYKIVTKSINSSESNVTDAVIEISAKNYTNILKTVHENIDKYVGKKIHLTGYVYRVFDLSNTQFVIARNMIINSDNQAVVVGFLCNYNNAKNFGNNTWIDAIGTITKGNYHGDIPIIEINEINIVDCPNDEFVYPPDNSFIPTNSII